MTEFSVPHIWTRDRLKTPAVVLLRRSFELKESAAEARLRLFAEAGYVLYVNGRWVGRGPTHRHPHRLPVEGYDIAEHLRAGKNVIAVLVFLPGEAFHHYVPNGYPGLSLSLNGRRADGEAMSIVSDAQWRCTADSGWSADVPRRSWATSHLEVYEASKGQPGWQAIKFDDSQWPFAVEVAPPTDHPEISFIDAGLPALKGEFIAAQSRTFVGTPTAERFEIHAGLGTADWGKALTAVEAAVPSPVQAEGQLDSDGGGLSFDFTGAGEDAAVTVEFDLGAQFTGHAEVVFESDSSGTVDVGWGERLDEGRVAVLQKGATYADRVIAEPGVTEWQPYQFNAGRYLRLDLRGFTGRVDLKRVGWFATEPDLSWDHGQFSSSDALLNRIFETAARTVRVGTQEALMDCPTRERATYLADGLPTAYWIALLTGDARHWRHLLIEGFARLSSEGLPRSTTFSGRFDTLLDFGLLAVAWADLYLRFSGDQQTLRQILPALRANVEYFNSRVDERGLFDWAWNGPLAVHQWEQKFETTRFSMDDRLNLFIDHAGMGWHNIGEPGIDRRGFNAAINLLRIRAMAGLANIESQLGNDENAKAWKQKVDWLTSSARDAFVDPQTQQWRDGELDGQRLEQLSQQTNTWALWSRAAAPDNAPQLADDILDADRKTWAQNGPYFLMYLFPELQRLGRTHQALEMVREKFGDMVERGATTVWETWAGDDHDSRCHPWSAAVAQFLLCGVAGLPSGLESDGQRTLRPRPDLVEELTAQSCLAEGGYRIEWAVQGESVEPSGTVPDGHSAELWLPGSDLSRGVRVHWKLTIPLAELSGRVVSSDA